MKRIIKVVSICMVLLIGVASLSIDDINASVDIVKIEDQFPDTRMQKEIAEEFEREVDDYITDDDIQNTVALQIFGGNEIESIAGIEIFSNLEEVSLSHINVTSLPVELKQLPNLKSLIFQQIDFAAFPIEVTELTGLENLSFLLCNIDEIPSEIENLTELKGLHFFAGSISALPAELMNLSNLNSLSIVGSDLQQLPENIGDLSSLTELQLSSNKKLKRVPASLAELNNLESLNLGDCSFDSIPMEVTQLANLKNLGLNNNNITVVPVEISNLTKLQKVGFHSNQIIDIPIDLYQKYSENSVGEFFWQSFTQNYNEGKISQSYELPALPIYGQVLENGNSSELLLTLQTPNGPYIIDNSKIKDGKILIDKDYLKNEGEYVLTAKVDNEMLKGSVYEQTFVLKKDASDKENISAPSTGDDTVISQYVTMLGVAILSISILKFRNRSRSL